jgi:rhodanese-related sulfurtransferase
MARSISKKIVPALLLSVLLPACVQAKEEFVKYSEVKAELDAKPAQNGSFLGVEELMAMQEKGESLYLLDARTKADFDRERIRGARLPRTDDYYKNQLLFQQKIIREAPSSKLDLEKNLKDVPRDAVIVTYCNKHCGLSKNLKLDLEALGFTNVRWLEGGIDDWREKGYPLEKE